MLAKTSGDRTYAVEKSAIRVPKSLHEESIAPAIRITPKASVINYGEDQPMHVRCDIGDMSWYLPEPKESNNHLVRTESSHAWRTIEGRRKRNQQLA